MMRLICSILLVLCAMGQGEKTLPNGVTYKVADGWRSVTVESSVAWKAPEGDLTVMLRGVSGGDADAVMAGAWKKISPGMN
ncbi:MAG: hypothetical protein FJW36_09720 [Acidobacteria bacterium]|nr:hypothetical protein [Acidobacteriota bacterium]